MLVWCIYLQIMDIKKLNARPGHANDQKFMKLFEKLESLLDELRAKTLSGHLVKQVNLRIDQINAMQDGDKKLIKELRKTPALILNATEKEMKLVAKNYYRNTWLVIGLSAFGLPLGVAFSVSINNMSFIGAGMPFGMLIGMAYGKSMDKKAKSEGRQLEFEV